MSTSGLRLYISRRCAIITAFKLDELCAVITVSAKKTRAGRGKSRRDAAWRSGTGLQNVTSTQDYLKMRYNGSNTLKTEVGRQLTTSTSATQSQLKTLNKAK